MRSHREKHYSERIGWLRAAVLGANDGIVSTASLIIGVVAASATKDTVLITGVAGLVAGAMSMAAGEYVSVSSQADTERSDLKRERLELASNPEHELQELTQIYIDRGLDLELAKQVARKLTAHDALGAHARDELGLSAVHAARPVQAAFASAGTFAAGAALPLLIVLTLPPHTLLLSIAIGSLVGLVVLGWIAGRAGGANVVVSATRVAVWGAIAMALTAGVGALFGVSA